MALLLALFVGAAARAEAAPSRTKRERPVTVTGNPPEPLPEVHVAADTPTWLWFPAQILKKTISVDQSRIRVLDVGERSIIVQAVEDYRDATLTGKGGATLRARLVTARKGGIGPGETVRVLVVVDTLPASADLVFTVEVRGMMAIAL